MQAIRQTSFRAGEWAPSMCGRSDLEAYQHALRRCRNFFISPQGAAVSRPGTRFVAETKTSGASKARLIPFVYSDTDSVVLEFGHNYLRFHRNGAPVLAAGVPYEIATPYGAASLDHLKFVQVGSILTITSPLHPPHELIRTNLTSWSLHPIDYGLPEHPFPVEVNKQAVLWRRENTLNQSTSDSAREWVYLITFVYKDGNMLRESQPFQVKYQVVTQSGPMRFKTDGWYETNVAGPIQYMQTVAPKFEFRSDKEAFKLWIPCILIDPKDFHVKVYRGRGQTFGLIGEVKGTTPLDTQLGMFFEDDGRDPDYSNPPPTGRVPFSEADKNYPAAITLHDQRMVLGNFAFNEAGTIRASAVNSYADFDRRIFDQYAATDASAAVDIVVASNRAEEIRSLVSLDRLLVFTQSSVWTVEGQDGNPIKPNDLNPTRVQLGIGAAVLDPIVVGGRVLWVRSKGRGVRDLVYDRRQRAYLDSDLSLAVPHLFESPIVSWAFAEDPYAQVWAVRADGKLLSLTYGDGGPAWAWHDTPGGVVESVCCVPETDEDAVYLVVRRGGNRRFVERMASRRISNVRDGMRLDCGVTQVDGTAISRPETVTVTGLAHLNGYDVHAVCDGRVFGPLRVISGQVTVSVPPKAPNQVLPGPVTTHVGLRFDAELELLDVPVDREKKKIVKRVLWEVEAAAGLWTGESFDRLFEWRQKTVAAGFGPNELVTDEAEVVIGSSWNRHGRAVLRQVDPLPVTVLGVTREGAVGG